MTAVLDDAVREPPALDFGGVPDRVAGQITARLLSRDFDQWAEQLARVGNCAHPIRLVGSSQTVDMRTGEVVGSYTSAQEPTGTTLIPCGNRRASVCPACSRTYAADTWHLIRAGAAGGSKGVPASVGSHPMVFATATAPSFGPVHSASKDGTGICRQRRTKSLCPHGRPTWCTARHQPSDRIVGQPVCGECYDHEAHVIWQWHAPELWRRFTNGLTRAMARRLGVPPSRLSEVASVQFAKVAEYQRRGVIHFHALIRLDGPKTKDGVITAPPASVDADDLAQLVHDALTAVQFTTAPIDRNDLGQLVAFGRQVDARPVRSTDADGDGLSAAQVAGYIAKYATKSITDPDLADPRSPHYARLRDTVRTLHQRSAGFYPVDENPYALLGKWEHMLGFRGHFSTKSRRYSTTLGRIRGTRRRWQIAKTRADRDGRQHAQVDLDELDDDTTLVIGQWTYAGHGWATDGETALATAAAARAREHSRERVAARDINHQR